MNAFGTGAGALTIPGPSIHAHDRESTKRGEPRRPPRRTRTSRLTVAPRSMSQKRPFWDVLRLTPPAAFEHWPKCQSPNIPAVRQVAPRGRRHVRCRARALSWLTGRRTRGQPDPRCGAVSRPTPTSCPSAGSIGHGPALPRARRPANAPRVLSETAPAAAPASTHRPAPRSGYQPAELITGAASRQTPCCERDRQLGHARRDRAGDAIAASRHDPRRGTRSHTPQRQARRCSAEGMLSSRIASRPRSAAR
jgi:hypothetical protein